MKASRKSVGTRKVVVQVVARRVSECQGDVVIEVPRNATDDQIREALVGCSLELPEPDNWSWDDEWWMNAEIESDEEMDPEIMCDTTLNTPAAATLVRDEDGNLVLG